MKIGTIIGFLIVIAIVGGMWWQGQATDQVQPSVAATIGTFRIMGEASRDLGRISMKEGVVTTDFLVKNNSQQALALKEIYTSCMCTEATITTATGQKRGPFGMPGHGLVPSPDLTLAPGEEATVTASFDPAAHGPAGVGPVDREIILTTTDGQKLSLGFTGLVTP